MKKIFIDCGFHHGEGLRQFIRILGINSEWTVHCFEPNPECHMHQRLMEGYDFIPDGRLTLINIVSHPKAVWIANGNVEFAQENHYRSESGSPTDGKSIIDGWRSRVKELTQQNDNSFDNPIPVECIDFSKFLEQFQGCEVYCKMDIEGAEFPVLRKLLLDGNVKLIKRIWVEFHDRDVPGESAASAKQLISELSKYTIVKPWD